MRASICKCLLERRDHLAQADRAVVPEVDDLVRRSVVGHRASHARHDVLDERVVAPGASVTEHGNRVASQQAPGEAVDGQVGPLTRSVDGKEPEGQEANAVQPRIHVAQQLSADLGAGVGTDRLEHVIVLAPRHARVHAVHTARGRKHELANSSRPGELEQRLRARHVRLLVRQGIGNGRPDACLGRQVHDDVEVAGDARQGPRDRRCRSPGAASAGGGVWSSMLVRLTAAG